MNLEKAIAIAVEAHAGQADKAGQPYILHPLRVMMRCGSDDAKTVAVLHDVVEDTGMTLDALRQAGFSDAIVEAVDGMTKRQDESYEDFVRRAGSNPLSREVKIADISDNLNVARLPELNDEDLMRVKKIPSRAENPAGDVMETSRGTRHLVIYAKRVIRHKKSHKSKTCAMCRLAERGEIKELLFLA
jgi:hypothetical protein